MVTLTLNVTASGAWTSTGSLLYVIGGADNQTKLDKVSQSTYRCYTYQQYSDGRVKVRFTVYSGGTSQTMDSPEFYIFNSPPSSCFTGDSMVTMADGSMRRIDEVSVGALVKTAVGFARVTQIDMPQLGHRPLVIMADGKCKTSAEHSFWTRNPASGEQWWATRDIEQWRKEAVLGAGPSFGGHEPFDLTGQDGLLWDFAMEDGFKTTTWYTQPADPSTQLYHLLLDEGGSYFVDGYLISSIADTGGVDWETFSWK